MQKNSLYFKCIIITLNLTQYMKNRFEHMKKMPDSYRQWLLIKMPKENSCSLIVKIVKRQCKNELFNYLNNTHTIIYMGNSHKKRHQQNQELFYRNKF